MRVDENIDKITCAYCSYVIAYSIESAQRHIPLHSCLASSDHINIDEQGRAFIYEYNYRESATEENVNDANENHLIPKESDKWTHEATLLLICTYDKFKNKFSSPMYNKRQVWKIISDEMCKKNITKSAEKCDEKWRNLKKHYDKVLRVNNTTGAERKTWIYFEKLHSILFQNPSINPIATCSSTGAFKQRISEDNMNNLTVECDENINDNTADDKELKKRKRESKEDAKERRHKERMQQREKFFNLFKSYLEEQPK
ncbi:myb/sant-like dna-binding domain [Holotrichia oblita]|uniref:Myb/sant-like dna-binding domain n=1 Tax=Holotrichia oblita TaxID=644536 RepID=A0ACB9T8D1_HOLOL|nr:myb/sant-like dna-binding domain [Holotrichia oblita]